MSLSNHSIIVTRNNMSMRNHASYFKYRGEKISHDQRVGTPMKKLGFNKNAFQLSQERKAVMFRKGIRNAIGIGLGFLILSVLVVCLLS